MFPIFPPKFPFMGFFGGFPRVFTMNRGKRGITNAIWDPVSTAEKFGFGTMPESIWWKDWKKFFFSFRQFDFVHGEALRGWLGWA